jgi:exosortase/archaeosortase family protein
MNFSVDVACSGVYSLIGFAIFAVFIAYITRGKLWTKVGILLLGVPLIIALNIIRITTILGIGYNFGDLPYKFSMQ